MARLASFMISLFGALVLVMPVQGATPYDDLSVGDMISDGSRKVSEIQTLTEEVGALRRRAQEAEDVAAFQRLDAFHGQMETRQVVAEEALATLQSLRNAASGRKQPRQDPRSLATYNYGLILAAHTSVQSLHRQALAVVNAGVSDGDGTQVEGGAEGLPDESVVTTGEATDPHRARDLRDNSEFHGRTPSTLELQER